MNNELENISVMNYYKDYKLICDNMKPNMGNLVVGYMSFVIAIVFVIYTFVFKDGSFASKFFELILALIFIGFGFVQVMSANMFKKTAEKFLKELEEDIENPEYETTKIVFYGQGVETVTKNLSKKIKEMPELSYFPARMNDKNNPKAIYRYNQRKFTMCELEYGTVLEITYLKRSRVMASANVVE